MKKTECARFSPIRQEEVLPTEGIPVQYSELTKTSTALPRLAVTCVLSAARRLALI